MIEQELCVCVCVFHESHQAQQRVVQYSRYPLLLSCNTEAHQALYVVGCTLLFFPSPHICFLLWHSPPVRLRVFPSSLSDSGPLRDCFPGSEQRTPRAGSSAYHTCCKIKGHSWKPRIMGEVKLYFLSFYFVFDHPIWPTSTCTPTPPHACTQVLFFNKGSYGMMGVEVW